MNDWGLEWTTLPERFELPLSCVTVLHFRAMTMEVKRMARGHKGNTLLPLDDSQAAVHQAYHSMGGIVVRNVFT